MNPQIQEAFLTQKAEILINLSNTRSTWGVDSPQHRAVREIAEEFVNQHHRLSHDAFAASRPVKREAGSSQGNSFESPRAERVIDRLEQLLSGLRLEE